MLLFLTSLQLAFTPAPAAPDVRVIAVDERPCAQGASVMIVRWTQGAAANEAIYCDPATSDGAAR